MNEAEHQRNTILASKIAEHQSNAILASNNAILASKIALGVTGAAAFTTALPVVTGILAGTAALSGGIAAWEFYESLKKRNSQGLLQAIAYWHNTSSLIPDLPQVLQLHYQMFREDGGRLRTSPCFINSDVCTDPAHIKEDYRQLTLDSAELLPGLGRMPAQDKDLDPDNPEHWPDPEDQQAWINRAIFVSHFHARFIFIHPFEDGNGRVARLIAWEQLRRLFPEVSRLQGDTWLAAVDGKNHPFFSSMNYPDAKTAYATAMRNLKGGKPNLFYLATYFMPKQSVSLPFPLMSPFSISPTCEP